jgi:hypothetical protein
MSTWGELAELTLKRFYGGVLLPSDQKVTMRQVMIHLRQSRDLFMDQELSRYDRDKKMYDQSWYTRYTDQDILWDETRALAYVTLPDGYVDCRNNKGVRVLPMQGYSNCFIPLPGGWLQTWTELTHSEGNIGWTIAPATEDGERRIEFPTLIRGKINVVMLEVIARSTQNGEDDEARMPADYEDKVIRHTLELLGYKPGVDEANDDNDQQ